MIESVEELDRPQRQKWLYDRGHSAFGGGERLQAWRQAKATSLSKATGTHQETVSSRHRGRPETTGSTLHLSLSTCGRWLGEVQACRTAKGTSVGFHRLSSKVKGAKVAGCILVLWGEYFDEVAATIFTVTLRQAGLCVKVVGVNGLLAAGRNGLTLHADLALSEVVTWLQDTFCLVLPCGQAAVKRMENDPRIHDLVASAAQNGAKFVVQDQCVVKSSTLDLRMVSKQDIVTYARVENLITLAKEVANALLQAEQVVPTSYAHTALE